jgi:hypothetical protein
MKKPPLPVRPFVSVAVTDTKVPGGSPPPAGKELMVMVNPKIEPSAAVNVCGEGRVAVGSLLVMLTVPV